MPATATEAALLKLDNAFNAFARDNGDGVRDHDWIGANEYREEGFRIGEEAFDLPAEDRDDWIEDQVAMFPESAWYVVSCAAGFRLAELVKADDAYPFRAEAA